jgi:16S rRNA (uracil1498-N3)-methyltransferase
MTQAHFFLARDQWDQANLVLQGDEAKHCAQVTRHRIGDLVVVFDGQGRKAMARIDSVSAANVHLSVVEQSAVQAPKPSLTLVQAVVKGDTMEWIIEKAVELGVQRIVPLISQRSIVRLGNDEAMKKQAKWQRVALEACKQCGQVWVPEIAVPCSLAGAMGLTASIECKVTASLEPDATDLRSLAGSKPNSVAIAIGPEGDFTDAEYRQLQSAGWRPFSLGRLTLRSETAAICALSILGYQFASD